MRLWACCRLHVLGVALAVCLAIGFTIQILGIPFQKRLPPRTEQVGRLFPWSALDRVAQPAARTCQPKLHLVFLKTHKTGSSTILNILHRLGERRNLTFALPTKYQFSYPNLFHSRRVKGYREAARQKYDILCHHMRFYLPEVKKVMPDDAFFFSILRNPVTMAESSFTYYKSVSSAFKKAPSLDAFINDPQMYYVPTEKSNHYARNLLWFDFGFDNNAPFSPAYAGAVVAAVDRAFQLILLTEHFDESLVLLKEALCWDLDEVVAFKLNFRSEESVRTLSLPEVAKLRAWNALDWYLYDHFNRTFWQKVDQFGRERMAEEVRLLQARRGHLMAECLNEGRPVEASHIRDESIKPLQFGQAKIFGWVLKRGLPPASRDMCIRMVTPELQYKDLLDAKQFPSLNVSDVPDIDRRALTNRSMLLMTDNKEVRDPALQQAFQAKDIMVVR
ncbi:galactose-3-O-sulfotransferase 4 isoform X2 [Ambystoma mexicanum]